MGRIAQSGGGAAKAMGLLTSDDLSAMLFVSRRRVNQLIASGELDVPFIRVGRRRLVPVGVWVEWVTQHQRIGGSHGTK
jgi:hypothetical protein